MELFEGVNQQHHAPLGGHLTVKREERLLKLGTLIIGPFPQLSVETFEGGVEARMERRGKTTAVAILLELGRDGVHNARRLVVPGQVKVNDLGTQHTIAGETELADLAEEAGFANAPLTLEQKGQGAFRWVIKGSDHRCEFALAPNEGTGTAEIRLRGRGHRKSPLATM